MQLILAKSPPGLIDSLKYLTAVYDHCFLAGQCLRNHTIWHIFLIRKIKKRFIFDLHLNSRYWKLFIGDKTFIQIAPGTGMHNYKCGINIVFQKHRHRQSTNRIRISFFFCENFFKTCRAKFWIHYYCFFYPVDNIFCHHFVTFCPGDSFLSCVLQSRRKPRFPVDDAFFIKTGHI
jgi:hypothetical protein